MPDRHHPFPLASTLLDAFLGETEEHALLLLDPAGRVVAWLAAAERVFGYSAEEMLGKPFSPLFTPEDLALGLEQHELRTAARNGKAEDDRWQVRKDRGRFWASGVVTAHRDASGDLLGFSKILRDRTDEKIRADALEARVRAISEADERKATFLATLAHELGNHLYAVGMSVELIRALLPRTEDAADVIQLLERQSAVTGRLVEDIRDVIRIGSDKLRIETRPIVLGDVLRRVVEACRPKADARRQELLLLVPDAPIVVEADADRLHQVFANLVTNAIKYTPEAGKVSIRMTTEGPGEAVTKIEDTGVGIAPEMQSHIFDLFTQETSSQEMAQGGYGLGLWLVKQLVDLHGGTVAVKSDGKGKGSEFAVRLPLKAASSPDGEPVVT